MRTGFYAAVLLVIAFNSASAQNQPGRFAYVFTDSIQAGKSWTSLRKLDLTTGEFSNVLIKGADKKMVLLDAATRKSIAFSQSNAIDTTNASSAFATGVAAAAIDHKNSRLYFAPMVVDQLRYLDLNTMKVYCVTTENFTKTKCDIGNPIARMIIANDGYGYMITNDARHLVRFTTTKKPTIADLGALIDDSTNQAMTIFNFPVTAGGDMVADADNNLYLFTPTNRVYKIDVKTRVTKYVTTIKGLQGNFITNGAAVDANGNVLISSSINNEAYYVVDPKTWTATAFKTKNGVYRSSDMATANILFASNKSAEIKSVVKNEVVSGCINVYPNPVANNRITVRLTDIKPGKYNLYLFDMQGAKVMNNKITVSRSDQIEVINFERYYPQGTYFVKIVGKNSKNTYNSKILVQ